MNPRLCLCKICSDPVLMKELASIARKNINRKKWFNYDKKKEKKRVK